jgi:hypothetical protein
VSWARHSASVRSTFAGVWESCVWVMDISPSYTIVSTHLIRDPVLRLQSRLRWRLDL